MPNSMKNYCLVVVSNEETSPSEGKAATVQEMKFRYICMLAFCCTSQDVYSLARNRNRIYVQRLSRSFFFSFFSFSFFFYFLGEQGTARFAHTNHHLGVLVFPINNVSCLLIKKEQTQSHQFSNQVAICSKLECVVLLSFIHNVVSNHRS